MAWNLAEAFSNRFGNKDDYDEDYYLDEEDEVEEEKPAKKAAKPAKTFGKISAFSSKKEYSSESEQEIFAIQPTAMEDLRQITDKLLEGKSVIINTESCDDGFARRVFDFACGTAYALNCAFGRISYSASETFAGIYVITPENTNIAGAFQENFMQ
ncbi:MAG: cell division protein SepF [Lachnospiraceae bacterium]|nr:cell division protein SepF [Lachnospiraceae bacterium]